MYFHQFNSFQKSCINSDLLNNLKIIKFFEKQFTKNPKWYEWTIFGEEVTDTRFGWNIMWCNGYFYFGTLSICAVCVYKDTTWHTIFGTE